MTTDLQIPRLEIRNISKQFPGCENTEQHLEIDTIKAKTGNIIIFDVNSLMERISGDKEFLEELIAIFIKDTPKHFTLLKAAYENSNLEEIRQIAHTIKGSAGNFGASSLQKIALSLEQAAQEDNLSRVAHFIDAVEIEFEILKEEIRRLKYGTV